MLRIIFIIVFLCSLQQGVIAQNNDSLHVRISLLTCAPGQDLYTSFGHTAVRILDSAAHSDIVYNYGTFNFDQPYFYLKFVRGKLNFSLSAEYFDDFMYEYQMTQRSVLEQELNLTNKEKKFIITFLQNNYLPQNRDYKYDFLYDNCATRIRDVLFNKISGVNLTTSIVQPKTSFRDLLYFYLDRSGQPWSKLGIDILLGSPVDKKVTNNTAMFLPDFLSKGVSEATIIGRPYVAAKRNLIIAHTTAQPTSKYVPLIVVIVFCLLFLSFYFFFRNNVFATHVLDSILLYITGLIGLLLIVMWFGTDHQACRDNFNLLWALPTNIIVAFFIWNKNDWVRIYFIIVAIITLLLIFCWWFLPQHFNTALLPFCILMLVVYARLAKK